MEEEEVNVEPKASKKKLAPVVVTTELVPPTVEQAAKEPIPAEYGDATKVSLIGATLVIDY